MGEQAENVYLAADKTLNNIWWFTALTLISLVVLGIFLAYFLTFSLRAEVEKQTKVVEQKAEQIEIQLQKEAEINKEKERLLIEQKKAEKKLEEKIDELERFQKITIDREMKMIELKKKIDELK
jgi:cell division protein FtsX